ncbi:MAG: CBS domain-containing protein [Proteobacteria bacterium]|nr:CBS domain-containing protein [Pseudomonadota bacterium]
MRLADVMNSCIVKAATVATDLSIAEVAQEMLRADAMVAMVMEHGGLQGVLTADDILRYLTMAASPALAWNTPVTAAIPVDRHAVNPEETLGPIIAKMTAAEIDYLPAVTDSAIGVVSLCRLLQAENAFLQGEIQHLQTYIDALHDAPND